MCFSFSGPNVDTRSMMLVVAFPLHMWIIGVWENEYFIEMLFMVNLLYAYATLRVFGYCQFVCLLVCLLLIFGCILFRIKTRYISKGKQFKREVWFLIRLDASVLHWDLSLLPHCNILNVKKGVMSFLLIQRSEIIYIIINYKLYKNPKYSLDIIGDRAS